MRLFSEDLFDFADLLLDPTFGLLHFSLGLQTGVADQIAGNFFDGAGDFFDRSGGLVVGADFMV